MIIFLFVYLTGENLISPVKQMAITRPAYVDQFE